MKKAKLIILPALICLLLSGCGGRSISDYTIVQGVGIDSLYDKTIVSLQYLNLATSTGATDSLGDNITTVVNGESVNISDAIFSASKALSQEIFFGQNKLIVFGSSFIRDDISLGLDYLLRSVDSRPDVIVAASTSTADSIIKSHQRKARIPSESIYNLVETGEKNGIGVRVTVNDILRLYSSETSDIYMPVLRAGKDSVSCVGIAVFSNEKYAITLDDDRSLAFLLALGRVEDASLVLHDKKLGNIGIEITSQSAKKYVTIDDSKPVFHCKIKAKIILDDVQNDTTVTVSDDSINRIEKLCEAKIKSDLLSTLKICANAKSDPLEIGKYLAIESQASYNLLKDDWHDYLDDIGFDVTADVKLTEINNSSTR